MLEEWIRKNKGPEAEDEGKWTFLNSKKKHLLIIVICLGLLALIWPVSKTEPIKPTTINNSLEVRSNNLENSLAKELENILAQIDGAGVVNVSLTLSSEGIKSYATNIRDEKRDIRETDNKGLKKNTIEESTTRDLAVSSGSPLLVEEKSPEILGVLVVADGASNSQIAERLTNATATLLNISVHQVTVMPRKGGI